MSDLNITKFTAINIQDRTADTTGLVSNTGSTGALKLGKVEGADIATIINNPKYDPSVASKQGYDNTPVADGTLVFVTTTAADPTNNKGVPCYFFNGTAVEIGGGAGGGDVTFVPTVDRAVKAGQQTTFAVDNDGTQITNGIVIVDAAPPGEDLFYAERRLQALSAPTTSSGRIRNLGYLQFSNINDPTTDNSEGHIFLDSESAVVFQHQSLSGGSSNVCTTFTGGVSGETSSSPNAIVEINSTVGGLLLSRLSTDDITTLTTNLSAKDYGLMIFNKSIVAADGGAIQYYTKTGWKILGTSTPPPSGIVASDVGVLNGITGTEVKLASVKLTSKIIVTANSQALSSLKQSEIGNVYVGNIKEGDSFTVYSTVGADTRSFAWLIVA